MTNQQSSRNCLFGVLLMLTVAISPIVSAQNTVSADILTEWVDDGTGNTTHGYRIVLDQSLSFSELEELSVTVLHTDADENEIGNWVLDWTGGNNTELSFVVDSTLSWKDQIVIEVGQNDCCNPSTVIGSRTIQVTIWNEPLSDHEITRVTNWNLVQNTVNFTDSESWALDFIGQGWQQRTGDVLVSNELGTGMLSIEESTEGGTGTVAIMLWLDTVWLNETVNGMDLQSQIFEMRGNGTIGINSSEDGINTEIFGNVVNSYIIRSLDQGVVEEQVRIEANGGLQMSSEGGGESMEANGTLALLLVEIHDIDGQRVLSNTEFEGTADMIMTGDDYEMDLDINQIISRERWENGQLHSSLNRIQGDGAFDFSDQEENSSIVVNATVYDFFTESVNGNKTGDRIHVDGTFSGDVNGDFGTVRDIIDTKPNQENSTGEEHNVNIIKTESWLNLSGVGNNPFDMEAMHNQTWEYEVPQEHWDNRTIRLRWDSMEGGEPSEGEEFPERSPIQHNMTAPEANSTLGDVDITRETGLSPAGLMVGDRIDLLGSELMHLSVTATSTGTVVRDGHTIPVTYWDGAFGGDGQAQGAVINEGILAGLIAEVTRNVTMDLDEGDSLEFGETQSLARVLSPSITTESENTPPTIESVMIREGSITNEGESIAHLEVTVDDPDWNVRSVTADLSSLSLGTVVLNDVGLDGDTSIHDETYTVSIEYPGTLDGDIIIEIEVADDWASIGESHSITILNRLPQISTLTFTPITVNRGDTTNVVLTANDGSGVTAVGIDTTQWGGNVTWLTQLDGNWVGEISVPVSIPSGDQVLPVRLEDGAGGSGSTSKFGTGEDLTALHILNEGPAISNVTFYDNGEVVSTLPIPLTGVNEYILTAKVTDYDTISIVQAKLGVIAPPGQSNNWISMRDDGLGADAEAGDGIWSVTVEVRPGVSGGITQFEIRGIDQQLAQTPLNERSHEIELGNSEDGSGGGQAVLKTASNTWLIISLIGVIILVSLVGLAFWIRGGGLKQMMLPTEDPWK
ncbi:MAG: choice-of-anchor X domain-containing protein [Candidatus Thermoplasmatota archaeon]|nr:choice-of-anchor X domain-containing protein [Candidatus Thermoplasmatota archaeon]